MKKQTCKHKHTQQHNQTTQPKRRQLRDELSRSDAVGATTADATSSLLSDNARLARANAALQAEAAHAREVAELLSQQVADLSAALDAADPEAGAAAAAAALAGMSLTASMAAALGFGGAGVAAAAAAAAVLWDAAAPARAPLLPAENAAGIMHCSRDRAQAVQAPEERLAAASIAQEPALGCLNCDWKSRGSNASVDGAIGP